METIKSTKLFSNVVSVLIVPALRAQLHTIIVSIQTNCGNSTCHTNYVLTTNIMRTWHNIMNGARMWHKLCIILPKLKIGFFASSPILSIHYIYIWERKKHTNNFACFYYYINKNTRMQNYRQYWEFLHSLVT